MDREGSTLTRLAASAERLETLNDEVRAEEGRRDELVVQARDEGSSWSTIARHARRSITRCVTIVSGE